jgi:quinol monooxygenase YgiN
MYVILKRTVKDYEAWKGIVSDGKVRKEKGSRGLTVHRSKANPNEVYIVAEWDDKKSYRDYFDLPEVQKSLAETGTTEVIEVSESFKLKA